MTLKLLIVALYCISVIHCAFSGESIIKDEEKPLSTKSLKESLYTDQDEPVLQKKVAGDSGSPSKFKPTKRKGNHLFQRVYHPKSQSDNTRIKEDVKEDWRNDPHYTEISNMIDRLKQELETMKKISEPAYEGGFPRKAIERSERSIKTLERASSQIAGLKSMIPSTVKKIKVSNSKGELVEKLQDSPSDQSELFLTSTLKNGARVNVQNIGNSLVFGLSCVINDDTRWNILPIGYKAQISDKDTYLTLLQRAGLKTVDYFINNNFASSFSVKSIFQDPEMVDKVITYSFHRFNQDIQFNILEGGISPYISEHWYWPLLHDSFIVQLLGKKGEKIINTTLLVAQLRHHFEQFLVAQLSHHSEEFEGYNYYLPPLLSLLDSSGIDGFWEKFGVINRFKNPLLSERFAPKINPEDFRSDIERAIHLLLLPHNGKMGPISQQKQELDIVLLNLLHLLEEYYAPGVILDVVSEHPRFKEFQDRFIMIQLCSKIYYLKQKLESYYNFGSQFIRRDPIEIRNHQFALMGYIKELRDIRYFPIALAQNTEASSNWLKHYSMIHDIRLNSAQWLQNLEEKSKSFLV